MQPRICVPIMQRDVQRTVRAVRQVNRLNPDLVEIRFDAMKASEDIGRIRDATGLPLIATNRRSDQGGLFRGTEERRLAVLEQASQEDFEYVDLELVTRNVAHTARKLERNGAKAIISYHNEKSTPSQHALEKILSRQKRTGAYVCKIVCTATSYADNLRILDFTRRHAKKSRLVSFLMGNFGAPSRVLSPLFGAFFTFASFRVGRETATGQIPIEDMRAVYRVLGVR